MLSMQKNWLVYSSIPLLSYMASVGDGLRLFIVKDTRRVEGWFNDA